MAREGVPLIVIQRQLIRPGTGSKRADGWPLVPQTRERAVTVSRRLPDGRTLLYSRRNSPRAKPPTANGLFAVGMDGQGNHQVAPWKLGSKQWESAPDRTPQPTAG